MTTNAALSVVHVRAPGKINVFLRVGALMPDGYHDVATAYQAVSLYEEVFAYPADDFSVSFTGSINTEELVTDGSNLAMKAARLLARRAHFRGGVRLEISKNIPIAGGMGGGSADAAATLLACDTLWGTDVGREELLDMSSQLGADVPFAFTGGTAIGTERGDQLSPALAQGTFHWVLVFADFGSSTPEVYRELDRHRNRHPHDIFPPVLRPHVEVDVLHALRVGDPQMLAAALHNDLQAPALHIAPRLAEVLELGESHGALSGIVSGSGPTLAFLAADLENAMDIQSALGALGHHAVHVTGPVHGARLVHD